MKRIFAITPVLVTSIAYMIWWSIDAVNYAYKYPGYFKTLPLELFLFNFVMLVILFIERCAIYDEITRNKKNIYIIESILIVFVILVYLFINVLLPYIYLK